MKRARGRGRKKRETCIESKNNKRNVLYKILHSLTHLIRSRFPKFFFSFLFLSTLLGEFCTTLFYYICSIKIFFSFFLTPCVTCCKILRSGLSLSSKKKPRHDFCCVYICKNKREREVARSFVFGRAV